MVSRVVLSRVLGVPERVPLKGSIGLLGFSLGFWGISRVIRRVTVVITHIGGNITKLITTHEPPNKLSGLEAKGLGFRV